MSKVQSVAIYGDSFADPLVKNASEPFDNIGWPDILDDQYDVINYARGGSSIYYAYQKFLESYKDADKIIFVVTDYYRWFNLVHTPTIQSPWGDFYHSFAGPGMIDYWRNDPMYKTKIDVELASKFSALEQYFVYLNDSEFDKTICKLMLDDVQRLRPDTIFVQGGIFPAFHPAVNHEKSLGQFALKWIRNWPGYYMQVQDGYGFLPWQELKTICHFAKEVNQVIAKLMLEALDVGIWDPVIPDIIVKEHCNLEYYYDVNKRLW